MSPLRNIRTAAITIGPTAAYRFTRGINQIHAAATAVAIASWIRWESE